MSTQARYNPDAPPDDFPRGGHEKLIALVTLELLQTPRMELLFALQAVVHRFCAAAEHDEDFAESVRAHGTAPAQPDRYVQQRELFEFFENGHAAIEASCYAAYVFGALVLPTYFPLASEPQRKQITPKETAKRFRDACPEAVLTQQLEALLQDARYDEWSKMRNVLAHRLAPGRIVGVECQLPDWGVVPAPPTEWNLTPGGLPLWSAPPERLSLVIDHQTTSTRRAWLAGTLAALLEATAELVSESFASESGTT